MVFYLSVFTIFYSTFKIGSATALIGDPSGKNMDRKILPSDQIINNSNEIQKSVFNIFKNHEEYLWKRKGQKSIELPKVMILNNIKWYENINIIQFLANYGKYFRMGSLLSRKQ